MHVAQSILNLLKAPFNRARAVEPIEITFEELENPRAKCFEVTIKEVTSGARALRDKIASMADVTNIQEGAVRSSNSAMFSTDFTFCHALILFKEKERTCVMAHMSCNEVPWNMVHGYGRDDRFKPSVDVKAIFPNSKNVYVINLYHEAKNLDSPNPGMTCYSDTDMDFSLNREGFPNVIHIPIIGEDFEKRDIFFDTNSREIFVLPRYGESDTYYQVTLSEGIAIG